MSDSRIGAVRGGAFAPPQEGKIVKEGSLEGPPDFPVAAMGVSAMLAQLVSQSARENAKACRENARAEKESQAQALEQQVGALMAKADDTRSEGILSGTLTMAGGAITVASVGFAPTVGDDVKAAQWTDAAKASAGTAGSAAFASIAQQARTMQASADAVRTLGTTIGQGGAQYSHGVYGSKQLGDEASSTRAAADAKFHESAKDEYESLAKEAKGVADKVSQFLQAVQATKEMSMRGILKMA